MSTYANLAALKADGKAIRLGSTGAGWMGSGFVAAVSHIPGMRIDVLADADPELARNALVQEGGVDPAAITETDVPAKAEDALRRGRRVVTGDPTLASRLESVDIVTDVTPSPASGARTAAAAIDNGKDVVLINIETDVTVGSALKRRAKRAGVFYSVSSGDEPGCLMELWDFVLSLGYTPIVIGKGKNNPLNVDATPETVAESARKSNKDPFQVASYVDGTKTMFELTCVANATGCRPMRPGMIGPVADQESVSKIFALKEDGGIAEFPGAVDYVQGTAMSGGVFITVRVDDSRIQDDLNYLKVGKGRYFTFFRPYHLWFLEAPISIARAYFQKETTLVALDDPVADVVTVAKRELRPGETLDDFGGYMFRGRNCVKSEAVRQNALPAGLAPGARIERKVAAGEIVTWDDVALDESEPIVVLRREQDDR